MAGQGGFSPLYCGVRIIKYFHELDLQQLDMIILLHVFSSKSDFLNGGLGTV